MDVYFLITGSRDWPESHKNAIYKILDDAMAEFDEEIQEPWRPIMINGCARGVDQWCLDWASDRGYLVEEYPADWNQFGKAAGPIRNKQMIDRLAEMGGGYVFAFFYGDIESSRGTMNCVQQALRSKMPVEVTHLEKEE